jgi:hypothetical protein
MGKMVFPAGDGVAVSRMLGPGFMPGERYE